MPNTSLECTRGVAVTPNKQLHRTVIRPRGSTPTLDCGVRPQDS
jgi:hypothetical protein